MEPGSPGDKAKLHGSTRTVAYNGLDVALGGDMIVKIGAIPVADAGDVSRAVTRLAVGQKVRFTIIRNGTERKVVLVTLGERPA